MINVQKLSNYIKNNGLKIKWVADQANVKYQKLSKVLNGRGSIEAGEYIRVCDALNVNPFDFVDGLNKKKG